MRRRRSSVAARTAPTAMALTRMPFLAHAAAIDPVRLLTAALAAPYGAACGIASRLAPEEMLTIAPLPWVDHRFGRRFRQVPDRRSSGPERSRNRRRATS